MMDAGKMNYLVVFEQPGEIDDGLGNTSGGWVNPVIADAAFRYLRAGETVQAARLSGRQPVVMTVHANSQTRSVDTSWRVRDTRSGDVFNVRSGPVPTDNHQYLEFTVERGVAV